MPDPTTLIAAMFILGVLIFIHESGHYAVAKALGIRVEVFSLGFGPKLLKFRRGDTEYCLSAIPLGGYVKMLGENPDEPLSGKNEEFLSRSKFERFLVLVMGASLNIVLAIALTAAVNMHGAPEPLFLGEAPVVGGLAKDGAGAEAGLRVNDEILEVDGKEVPTWRDLQIQIALNPHKTVQMKLRRDGSEMTLPVRVRATAREQIGIIGIGPKSELVISQVEQGGAAEKAGVRPNDHLVAVDGIEIHGQAGYEVFVERLSAAIGEPVRFTLRRDGATIDLPVVPMARETDGRRRGYVGVGFTEPMGIRKYGPIEAVVASVDQNWRQAGLLFVTLKKLVTLELSPRTLSGPIDIYRLTGESLKEGWVYYVSFMSLVSLQLGIINLLPIPILDGGHIFILLIEGLIRRDLSMRLKERVMQFGFILLLLIMGGVLSLDVYKNFFIE